MPQVQCYEFILKYGVGGGGDCQEVTMNMEMEMRLTWNCRLGGWANCSQIISPDWLMALPEWIFPASGTQSQAGASTQGTGFGGSMCAILPSPPNRT